MSEWMPIETAPKDGSFVLAIQTAEGDYHMHQQITCWHSSTHEGWTMVDHETKKKWAHKLEFWASYAGHPLPMVFSHWRPLPVPPAFTR